MGLTGETCTTDINECDDLDRCLSGSTCRNEFGGYRCECAPGFTGQNCGEDINECINNPCLNGGVCTNEIGSFSCNCTDGYLGETCGDVEPCFRNCSEACLPGMVINFIYFWQVRILTTWLWPTTLMYFFTAHISTMAERSMHLLQWAEGVEVYSNSVWVAGACGWAKWPGDSRAAVVWSTRLLECTEGSVDSASSEQGDYQPTTFSTSRRGYIFHEYIKESSFCLIA